ncbi:MAG: hypothetical protein ACFFKA_08030, partial [Candidatus Thorarchaeota archaeon]
SVPRKFWCRISAELIKKGFNFSLFGETIVYLYKQKYKHIVKAIEVFIISKNSSLINEFINVSKPLYDEFRQKIRRRVEKWAKRVDCEYNWGCDVCPYQEDCYKIKQTLIKREEL